MSSNYKKPRLIGAWWVVLVIGVQLLAACGEEGTPVTGKKEADLPRDRALVLSNKDGWPDLYTVDLTGKFVGRLTESAAAEYTPAWSPDGRQVVFTELNGDQAAGDYAKGRRIVVIDAEGKNRKVVTQEGFNPVWSPDSQKIMFTRLNGTASQVNSQVANIAAAPPNQIRSTVAPTATPGNGPTTRPAIQTAPVQSIPATTSLNGPVSIPSLGDGTTPAPATTTTNSAQQSSLYVVTVDSGQPGLLVAGAVSGSWSPDGKRLAYIGGNNIVDQKRTLNLASGDGSSPVSLSEKARLTDLDILYLSWSPDGTALAFTATDTQKDKTSLYRINPDSNSMRRLADYDGSAHEIMSLIWAYSDFYNPASRLHLTPAWSPNSRSLAFSDGSARIQVVDAATGNVRYFPVGSASLGQDKASVLGVSWLPDNRRLVYDRANVGRNTLQLQAGNYIYDFFEETLETLDTVNKNTLTLVSGPGATFTPTCCGMDLLGVGSPTDTPGATTSAPKSTATPASNITVTSKEGKLVYVSGIGQRQLIVNDLSFGTQTVITSGTFKLVDFNLAPKGDKMVYVEVGERFNSALYLVGLDGKDKRKLSEGNGNPDDLGYLTSWSADGKQLAFQALSDDKQLKPGLYTIATGNTGKEAGEPHLITSQNVSAFAWSPDGSQLAYRLDNQTYELYLSPADGSTPGKQIASLGHFDTRFSSLGKGLAWSPDGHYIAMSGAGNLTAYNSIWNVWLITPQGNVEEQPGFYINRLIGFSPDSARLIATVATSNQTSSVQAFVLGNGSNITRGWRSYDRGAGPIVSPDSLNMVYFTQSGISRFDGGYSGEDVTNRLVVLSFSTGNTRPLTLDYMPYYGFKARFFSWEPGNGRSLIFYQNNSIYITTGQGQPLKSEVLARAFSVDRLGWTKG